MGVSQVTVNHTALKLVHGHRLLYKLENGTALNEQEETSADKSRILKFNCFFGVVEEGGICFAVTVFKI